jgi:hypothetical protein
MMVVTAVSVRDCLLMVSANQAVAWTAVRRRETLNKESSMRAALCALLAFVAATSVGCHHNVRRNGHHGHRCNGHTCNSCGHSGLLGGGGVGGHLAGGGLAGGGLAGAGLGAGQPSYVAPLPHGYMQQQMAGPPGPATPSVVYPYYTTRAPRDFLLDNPPSIGP